MSTALTHGVWPDALTCTLPRDCLRLGWLGAADDPVLANMCELLAERITSEIVTTVFLADGDGCVGFEVLNGDECGQHSGVHSDQFAHQVASLRRHDFAGGGAKRLVGYFTALGHTASSPVKPLR